MSTRTIHTSSDTATRTRISAGRLGTQVFSPSESALGAGAGLEESAVRTYLAKVLPGVEALIARGRQKHIIDDDTIAFRVAEDESEVAHLRRDWEVAMAAMMHDLGRAFGSSGYPRSRAPYGAATKQFSDEEEREPSEDELEMVDWDVRIETPPPRRAERFAVTFREGSYRPPRIVDDPED